jgi:hypothetical protein
VVGEGADGEPDPGVALTRADVEVVAAEACAGDEALVDAAPLPPPKPAPPPRSTEPPMPRPTEGLRPMLRPEDPALTPNPRSTPAETETPAEVERLTPRMGLLDGPMATPPLTPTPGLTVAVAITHPFKMLPPLLHVPVVMRLLIDVGIVTRELRLEASSGVLGEIDAEGRFTPTPAPTVTDAATVAETLTPGKGILSESEDNVDKGLLPVGRPELSVKLGRIDSRDVTPLTTASGM